MSTTITLGVELTQISCGECGGTYAINERYRRQCHDHGRMWTCPYCKVTWGYPKSRISELEAEIAKQKESLARKQAAHDQTKAELRETESRRRGEKAAKTRLKNKIQAGECPCCGEVFPNLKEHMQAQHSDFEKEDEDLAAAEGPHEVSNP